MICWYRFLILGEYRAETKVIFPTNWLSLKWSPEQGGVEVEDLTRPEVSECGPAITNLIQGVAREEADRHRQIEVSMDLPLCLTWPRLENFRG